MLRRRIRAASIAGMLMFGIPACLADEWIQLATTVTDQPTCGARIDVSQPQRTFSIVRLKVIEGSIKITGFTFIVAGRAPGEQLILFPIEPLGVVLTEGQSSSFSVPLGEALDAVAFFGDRETCVKTRIEISALQPVH